MSRGLRANAALTALVTIAAVGFVITSAAADDAGCVKWEHNQITGEVRCVLRDTTDGSPGQDFDGGGWEDGSPGDDGSDGGVDERSDATGGGERWSGQPWSDDSVDDLDEDSQTAAPGGGSGEPPPSCRYVPRPGLTRRGGFANTIDQTGQSYGYVYERICDDGSRTTVVRETPVPPDEPTPGEPLPPPPPPDPGDLARELYGEMIVRLPTPTVRVAPADSDSNGWAYVQTPTFFWVDEWAGMSASLTVGSVSVTLTIEPTRLDVEPGDGGAVSCPQAPPFPPGADPTSFDGCSYIYRHSSAMAGGGAAYAVEATMVWTATWTSNVGAGGSLGELTTTGERDLEVAEVQAILVEG